MEMVSVSYRVDQERVAVAINCRSISRGAYCVRYIFLILPLPNNHVRLVYNYHLCKVFIDIGSTTDCSAECMGMSDYGFLAVLSGRCRLLVN